MAQAAQSRATWLMHWMGRIDCGARAQSERCAQREERARLREAAVAKYTSPLYTLVGDAMQVRLWVAVPVWRCCCQLSFLVLSRGTIILLSSLAPSYGWVYHQFDGLVREGMGVRCKTLCSHVSA